MQAALLVFAEVERLVQEKDTAQLCPYYLDVQPEALRLQVCFLAHGFCPVLFASPAASPSIAILAGRTKELSSGMRQAIADKVKSISSTMTLVTTTHGHLHVQVGWGVLHEKRRWIKDCCTLLTEFAFHQVTAANIQLGTEVQSLNVLPVEVRANLPSLQYGPRLRHDSLGLGNIQLHLAKCGSPSQRYWTTAHSAEVAILAGRKRQSCVWKRHVP